MDRMGSSLRAEDICPQLALLRSYCAGVIFSLAAWTGWTYGNPAMRVRGGECFDSVADLGGFEPVMVSNWRLSLQRQLCTL